MVQARENCEIQAPKTYLFAIARNLAVDRIRRSKIIQFDSLTDFDLANVIDDMEPVSESITLNQELEFLNKAIGSPRIDVARFSF